MNRKRDSALLEQARALPGQAVATGLALCAALALLWPASVRAADAAFEVSYLEVPASAAAATRPVLQRYAATEQAAAVNAGAMDFHCDVLQEIDRPERWLLLEWADNRSQLQAIDGAGAVDFARLQGMLVAPPDRRANHPLPAAAAGTAADDRPATPRGVVYAVTHLDIGQQDQSSVLPAVSDLVEGARQARGNLDAEAWQQNGRANHYALLFVWRRRADRDAFAGGPVMRRYRTRVGSLLGSPYDERLYRMMN